MFDRKVAMALGACHDDIICYSRSPQFYAMYGPQSTQEHENAEIWPNMAINIPTESCKRIGQGNRKQRRFPHDAHIA
eukprot:scaffold1006_cov270-Pinguiococcus_pyrenoidosus.AAC.23